MKTPDIETVLPTAGTADGIIPAAHAPDIISALKTADAVGIEAVKTPDVISALKMADAVDVEAVKTPDIINAFRTADAVGIDIVEVARFEGITETSRGHFFRRCFSDAERAYLSARNAQSRAGMFAAKEAVVKALGTGFTGFWPCDVQILHNHRGRPYARLRGKARAAARARRVERILVSISHTDTTAVAIAVACKRKHNGHRGSKRA